MFDRNYAATCPHAINIYITIWFIATHYLLDWLPHKNGRDEWMNVNRDFRWMSSIQIRNELWTIDDESKPHTETHKNKRKRMRKLSQREMIVTREHQRVQNIQVNRVHHRDRTHVRAWISTLCLSHCVCVETSSRRSMSNWLAINKIHASAPHTRMQMCRVCMCTWTRGSRIIWTHWKRTKQIRN